jgi:hypothetical protein
MLRRIGTGLLATLVFTCNPHAQTYGAPNQCEVYVQVAFPNGNAVPVGTRIVVTGEATGVPMPLFTNRDGGARIHLAPGGYRVQVFSKDIEVDSAAATFRVYSGESTHNEYVTVRLKSNVGALRPVGVTQLQVPENARGYFTKAMRDLHAGKNRSAAKHLKQAVDIFPRYADALNVLGVIAVRDRDATKAEQYFRDAINADSSSTLALINLSRILLQRRRYDEGEQLVARAAQLDPRNPEALTLLAYFALLQSHYDDAIAVSQRVHGLDHKRYALVHFVAANAYERKKLHLEAASEYKQYLEESPQGPSAAQARAALDALNGLSASIR